MKDFLKKNTRWVVFAIFAVALDFLQRGYFFTMFFVYALFINFLASGFLKEKFKKIVNAVILVILISSFGLTVYVNWYLPRGPMIDTGETEEVCIADNRGCKEVERYVEDTRNLDIPEWAKFLKRYGLMTLLLIAFAYIASTKKEKIHE